MQSSVRVDAPRFPRPPSISNDPVQISREVSVASSRASSPRRRSSYSTMPPIYNNMTHARKANGSDVNSAAGVHQRWNSRASARSARSSLQSEGRIHTPDPELLDNNRESMKALAEFLMTKEPPPNHYMSMEPSENEKPLSPFRTAFNILGRNKRRKRKSQQLMRLPDSAVAAKTSSGARYIAISIPVEHDLKYQSMERHLPPSRSSSQRAVDRLDRTAVTVLKPVHELQESTSTKALKESNNDAVVQPTNRGSVLIEAPLTDIVGGQLHFNQPSQQQWKLLAGDQLPKRDSTRVQKSYIAVSPIDFNRQQESDPRHSGGTAYSVQTIVTPPPDQSRAVGEPLGATSNPLMKVDLPLRNSSMGTGSHQIEHKLHPLKQNPSRWSAGQIERAQSIPTTAFERGHFRGSSALSGQTGIESIMTVTSTGSTPSPPIVFTADIARKYSNAANGAGPQLVRSSTPLTSVAGFPVPRPKTAPPGSLTLMKTEDSHVPLSYFNHSPDVARRTASQKEGNVVDPRQNRQDRVRARKQHDIANARPKSSGHLSREIPNGIFSASDGTDNTASTANASQAIPQDVITPPKRSSRRRRNSQELSILRNACTLSPIMLVAVLPPYSPPTPTPTPTRTPSISTIRKYPAGYASNRNSTATVINTSLNASKRDKSSIHTPPRSHSSSPSLHLTSLSHESDIELERERSRLAHIRATSHQSLRSTLLATRRQERRAKRNMALKEKDLDTRMLRIERDNKVLLRTLGIVVDSFEEIRGLGTAEERGRQSLDYRRDGIRCLEDGGEDEGRRLRDLEGMEPVMRDLVGGMGMGLVERGRGMGRARNMGLGKGKGRLIRDFSEEAYGEEEDVFGDF